MTNADISLILTCDITNLYKTYKKQWPKTTIQVTHNLSENEHKIQCGQCGVCCWMFRFMYSQKLLKG